MANSNDSWKKAICISTSTSHILQNYPSGNYVYNSVDDEASTEDKTTKTAKERKTSKKST